MKSNKTEKQSMTAVQRMANFDATMSIMEGIGDKTYTEQKALTESMDDYVDESGVFDMDDLLGVDYATESQPQLYTTPQSELTDGDKSQIVEELAKLLSDMQGDVIDFSDIGPIATVIQTKLGYSQPLDGFIEDLISGATDKQDSQSFAKGEPVPGEVAAAEAPVVENVPEDKAPTDIAPTKAPIDEPVVEPVMDIEPVVDAPIVEELPPVAEEPIIEEPVVEEVPTDVEDVVVDSLEDTAEDVDLAEVVEDTEEVSAELEEVEEVVEDKTNDAVAEDIKEEIEDVEDEVTDVEDGIEDVIEEDDDKLDDDLDAQLEAIKSEYIAGKSNVETLVEEAQADLAKEVICPKCEAECECEPTPVMESEAI
jgi:hypothetical protein